MSRWMRRTGERNNGCIPLEEHGLAAPWTRRRGPSNVVRPMEQRGNRHRSGDLCYNHGRIEPAQAVLIIIPQV